MVSSGLKSTLKAVAHFGAQIHSAIGRLPPTFLPVVLHLVQLRNVVVVLVSTEGLLGAETFLEVRTLRIVVHP